MPHFCRGTSVAINKGGNRMSVSQQDVMDALSRVETGKGTNLAESGMVSDIFAADGKVYFALTVDAGQAEKMEPLRKAAEQVVAKLPGVAKAVVTLTAAKSQSSGGPAQQPQQPQQPRQSQEPPPSGPGGDQAGRQQNAKIAMPDVGAIIAVASGKGGVGKSTTSVNLALALQALGKRVAILDADIYGPSMPRLLGVSGKPQTGPGRSLKPKVGHGMKVMSMGFLVEEDTPMIWRGPMVISALTQMLNDVEWGGIDIMIVDMPPGTGDAQLTMAQKVPLAGAVIVSTPQDLALIDARKGLNMFRRVDVPVLGIVENMSYFIAPDTGARYDIFGHGGARKEAERIGVPFLGEVPLTMDIRELSDAGNPVVVSDPDGPSAAVYLAIAERTLAELEKTASQAQAPAIVFE